MKRKDINSEKDKTDLNAQSEISELYANDTSSTRTSINKRRRRTILTDNNNKELFESIVEGNQVYIYIFLKKN